jgi:hypothetical protein
MQPVSASTPPSPPQKPQTWIFQANPKRYRIHESLQAEREELWNLNQHVREVRSGDCVMIWICGKSPGIYAIGTVLSDPILISDTPTGITYWYKQSDGRRVKARVTVRYDRVFLERPLLKVYLEADPGLWKLKILATQRGTNFSVSQEEAQIIRSWLEN